jgi:hypothetical protein
MRPRAGRPPQGLPAGERILSSDDDPTGVLVREGRGMQYAMNPGASVSALPGETPMVGRSAGTPLTLRGRTPVATWLLDARTFYTLDATVPLPRARSASDFGRSCETASKERIPRPPRTMRSPRWESRSPRGAGPERTRRPGLARGWMRLATASAVETVRLSADVAAT